MKNPTHIIYAVSLHFSPDVSDLISQTVASIAEATGNRFIIENKIPPHVTIGAFHAGKEEEPKLLKLVEDFARTQITGQKLELKPEPALEPEHQQEQKSIPNLGLVHFTEIGNFNGKVLFLKPEKDAFLLEINRKLHDAVLPHFEKGENGYYTPENWFPHTTLATRLNQSQFSMALAIAEKIPLPLTAEACEIGFYQCSPFLELKRFTLV